MLKNVLRGDETLQCELKFTGPKYVVATPACAIATEATDDQIASTAYAIQEGTGCTKVTEEEQLDYWTASRCVKPNIRPAQIRHTREDTFIFCFGWAITIRANTMACLIYVFKLPLVQSFRIRTWTYSGNWREVQHTNVSVSAAHHDSLQFVPGCPSRRLQTCQRHRRHHRQDWKESGTPVARWSVVHRNNELDYNYYRHPSGHCDHL